MGLPCQQPELHGRHDHIKHVSVTLDTAFLIAVRFELVELVN